MKKLDKLCFLVPIPLIVGLVLDIVGYRVGNMRLAKAGIMLMSYGTPALMFILVVIGLILMITGNLSDDVHKADKNDGTGTRISKAEENPAADEETEKIQDINSSYGYESQMKQADYIAGHSANAYRNSSSREKVLGWLFFGFLMTDFAMIMVFAFVGIMVGAFVCMGLFAGTIIISLIIKKILEHTAMSGRLRKGVEYVSREGIVKACFLSSMTSTGGSRRNSTVRVGSVIYRVIIVVDGKEYSTYCRYCFDVGQKLWVTVRKDGRGGVTIQHLPVNSDDNA